VNDYALAEDVIEFFLNDKNSDALFAGAVVNMTDKKLIKKAASYVTTDLEGLHKDNDIEGSIVIKLITDNPDQAQELRDGADKLTAFFVGQAMKESKGTANPGTVAKLLKELL